jgi:tetratricopeptide (TPR) repeat protein
VKVFQVAGALVLAATVSFTLNACAADQQAKLPTAPNFASAEPAPAANTLSGSYLAGRFAQRQQDWDAAQNYMNEVTKFDEGNELLEQRAFLLSMGAMQYSRARELAQKIAQDPENIELASIYLACDALAREDYKGALGYIEKLPEDGFGQYTKPLLTAWAKVGAGDSRGAVAVLSDKADAEDPTFNIHAALIAELAGDKKTAGKHYREAMANGLTLHTAVLAANFFQRDNQPEISKAIYDNLGKLYPFSPFINAVKPANETPRNITRAADGAAVALFDLATLLYERRAYDSAQIYGAMVLLLAPKAPFAMMMMGDIAALHGNYRKAVDDYDTIAKNQPLYWLSRVRVSEVMEISHNLPQAIAMLEDLSKNKETKLEALVSLGDLHRRHEDFASALKAYDAALATIDKPTEEHWPLIYARGMARERMNDWAGAEKDLLQALAFQPDNPMILNFIGYSWADKGMHMDKALDYIRRAVAQRPDDGYIVDSLGWALYRAGNYKESIEWLERAVSIVPDDSTILDHLGDAYWQSGRKNEAKFKWQRAHELSRDTAFRATVENKITRGIDAKPAMVAHSDSKL